MKIKHIKKLLSSEIKKVARNISLYCQNPKTNFVRNRKLPAEILLKGIIGMENKSLSNELIDLFHASSDMPTKSAFVQQRYKIKPEAFKAVFDGFNKKIRKELPNELTILAADGSDIQIATNPNDIKSHFPGSNGQKAYNLLHLNALYDLSHHIYTDAIIQKARDFNERKALQEMVDRSNIQKALIIADRGYESYNNMAHVQEKGWFFLIRIKDGNHGIKKGLDLPVLDEYDISISLNLTRRRTNETKELLEEKNSYKYISSTTPLDYLPLHPKKHDPIKFYKLPFRIVRFQIVNGSYETVLTNLDTIEYPTDKIKQLYSMRWGIETSFRDLKYTIGLLNFHSKKVLCIQQEIYARLIMYNFAEIITLQVVINKKQRKHIYKANFSVAVHMCRLYFNNKTTSLNLQAIIAQNLIPIRAERQYPRKQTTKSFHSFWYRVA